MPLEGGVNLQCYYMRLRRGSSAQRGAASREDALSNASSEPDVPHVPVVVPLRDGAMLSVSGDDVSFYFTLHGRTLSHFYGHKVHIPHMFKFASLQFSILFCPYLLQEEYLSQDEGPTDMEDDLIDPSDDIAEPKDLVDGSFATAAGAYIKSGRFDKAIVEYSAALKGDNSREQQITLLLGRAEAYCGMSQHLRSIPAAESEQRAVYAPDPVSLASRALVDADNALRLESDRAKAVHEARGNALFLLERYNDAREAYRLAYAHCPGPDLAVKIKKCEQALSDDIIGPTSQVCGKEGGLLGVAQEGSGQQSNNALPCLAKLAAVKAQALQDAECSLCLKLLYEPVTTPCGHTFCSPCLARSYDHANKCPMCRTVLHVGQLPVSIVFKNLLERGFPEEYEARRLEEAESAPVEAEPSVLPLFVMSPMLPGEKMALNVFEPRYRLMVRRVMAGARRFGMATVNADHSLHDVCCEVEVTECEPLPDGRYYIEIVGRRRFKPQNSYEQDGYRVAKPEYVQDKVPEAGSAEATELEALSTEVESMADAWVGRMRCLGQSRRAAAELLRRMEPKPGCRDKERLSFWVVSSPGFKIPNSASKIGLCLHGRNLSIILPMQRVYLVTL